MDFRYIDDNNKERNISCQANKSWASIQKKVNNANFESVWKNIDNGDGIAQEEEIDLLGKMLQIASNSKLYGRGQATNSNDLNLLGHLDKDSTQQISNINENEIGDYIIRNTSLYKNPQTTEKSTIHKISSKMTPAPERDYSWSEGLDRKVSKISIAYNPLVMNKQLPVVSDELNAIGKEVGFDVEELSASMGIYQEDYVIRRHDGKVLVPSSNAISNAFGKNRKQTNAIIEHRQNISNLRQGEAVKYSPQFEQAVPAEEKVYSKSYLEGGNVLNTCLKDGTPAAVIGGESVDYTLSAMGLAKTDDNIEKAKQQIAEDLGLKPENITFIPQYDFHIDMNYRPLHNGEMAVPDYDAGIKLLKETQIAGMDESTKQKLIENLQTLNEKTSDISEQANKALENNGYKIVKVPCFSGDINYMNGVGGTSKTGKSFYITNKSDYPELNNAMEKYFNNIGIDNVYFVSTAKFLKAQGGIDCLTQER